MPYCLKCGAKVEDTMTFCPDCGTQLKGTPATVAPSPEASPKPSTAEVTQQKPAASTGHRQQKPEHGFIKYLVGGLILITVGVTMILELENPALATGQTLAIMLLTIGLIVILGSVYYAISGRRGSHVHLEDPTEKKPTQPAP